MTAPSGAVIVSGLSSWRRISTAPALGTRFEMKRKRRPMAPFVSRMDAPLALVGPDFANAAVWIGGIAFVVAMLVLYRWIEGVARRTAIV